MTRPWQSTGTSSVATRLLTAAALAVILNGCTSMPWDSTPFYGNNQARPTTLSTVPVPAGF
jgi:lipoprotein NlpD